MSRKTKALAVALTAIMVLSVFAYAPAAADASTSNHVLSVDDDHGADHNDDNDNDNEFETIQGAVNAAEPGDRIEVAPGTYNENVKVDVGDITIEGAGADAVTINGTGGSFTVTLGADDIDFRGFRVQAPANDYHGALLIYDLIDDSHVKGVLVEESVFVGNDNTNALAVASPPDVNMPTWRDNKTARDHTIRNNEFTGGTVGSMDVGLLLDARDSTVAGNTFSTKVEYASVMVTGPNNALTDNAIEYPGYAYSGLWIAAGGTDTTVDGLTVDGHLDEHLHQDQTRGDWLKYGVYVEGSGSTLSDVDVRETHIGISIGGAQQEGLTENVTLLDSSGELNRNHDLKIQYAKHTTVDNFDATSSVRPAEDEWSGFYGAHPTSGANVFVKGGYGHTLANVTSTSESPVGIAMHNVKKSTVDNAEIRNKGGAEPTLKLDDGDNDIFSTTGISLQNANYNTITNSLVTDNDVGIAIANGEGNAIEGNNPGIYNNSEAGVDLWNTYKTSLSDNDVRKNGIGLNATKSKKVRAKYNNFVGNGMGINAMWSYVDATWNWFGAENGPGGPATDGVLTGDGDSIHADASSKLKYDPFLTAPKDEVEQDPDKTKQYAHDLVTNGSQGIQTVGTPGPATVSFQFDGTAAVYTYGGDHFEQVTSSTDDAKTLDAYIITDLDHGENARVVVDFDDETPATPGSRQLDSGWNFQTAPQYGATEDVIRTTSPVLKVAHGYTQFDSQPTPGAAPPVTSSPFSYPMSSSSSGPNLSAYSGYWIYMNSEGDIVATVPSGVTINEEEGLIVA